MVGELPAVLAIVSVPVVDPDTVGVTSQGGYALTRIQRRREGNSSTRRKSLRR